MPLLGISGVGAVGVAAPSGVEVSVGVCNTRVLVGDASGSTVGVSTGSAVSASSPLMGITGVLVGVGSGVSVGVGVVVEVGVKVGGTGVGISTVIAASGVSSNWDSEKMPTNPTNPKQIRPIKAAATMIKSLFDCPPEEYALMVKTPDKNYRAVQHGNLNTHLDI